MITSATANQATWEGIARSKAIFARTLLARMEGSVRLSSQGILVSVLEGFTARIVNFLDLFAIPVPVRTTESVEWLKAVDIAATVCQVGVVS